jgi:hypothetical protein
MMPDFVKMRGSSSFPLSSGWSGSNAPAGRQVLATDRFESVVEHISRFNHHLHAPSSSEIGVKISTVVCPASAPGCAITSAKCRAPRPADRPVDEVMTTWPAELRDRDADMLGLMRVERLRQAGLHVAEGAGPRAGVRP